MDFVQYQAPAGQEAPAWEWESVWGGIEGPAVRCGDAPRMLGLDRGQAAVRGREQAGLVNAGGPVVDVAAPADQGTVALGCSPTKRRTLPMSRKALRSGLL